MVKIFKLLINELNQLDELILFGNNSECTEDDNELTDETVPNNQQNARGSPPKIYASDLWYDDEEDDEDDQLLKDLEQDPIFQTSLKETLKKFLQNFATTEKFAEYAQQLNEDEKNILRRIHVNF